MKIKEEVTLVFVGEAGQGLASIQQILIKTLKQQNHYFFSTSEYMSRVRGGINTITIRITSNKKRGNLQKADIMVLLCKNALEHVKTRIKENTIILGTTKDIDEKNKKYAEKITKQKIINVPFEELAKEIGNKIYTNIIAITTTLEMLKINTSELKKEIKKTFSKKGQDIIKKNLDAIKIGEEQGRKLQQQIKINIKKNKTKTTNLKPAQAITYGAIAAGCNFVSAYPMSPSTSIITEMAKQSEEFNVIVEQAEDEIGAINMCLGATYAGARALANTSGGGFALMSEAVSLAGMMETPIVVHVAQRPGPATGLPTRTAQEDLNLTLYAGHGEFTRIIYAPSTINRAFEITHTAFNKSEEYQIPVFILTDQYFLDTQYNTEMINLKNYETKNYIIKTTKNYQRYQLTKKGISPRGIPGHGEGLICADSDEHEENGHITENFNTRKQMVQKRLERLKDITKKSITPIKHGPNNYEYLVIGWGSTYETIKETLQKINNKKTLHLQYEQIYPLHPKTRNYLKEAKKIIVIEGNATGQFTELIKKETNKKIQKILRYDGLQFTIEELEKELKKIIK